MKGGARAPVDDSGGAMSLKDAACMATPKAGDPALFRAGGAKHGAAHTVGRAESGRAKCKVCRAPIAAGELRLGFSARSNVIAGERPRADNI